MLLFSCTVKIKNANHFFNIIYLNNYYLHNLRWWFYILFYLFYILYLYLHNLHWLFYFIYIVAFTVFLSLHLYCIRVNHS